MIRTPTTWSDWMLSGLQKFPMLVAACLLTISTTCGGLALCLGGSFYFFKLTQMSQDVIENIIKKFLKVIGLWLKKMFKKDIKKDELKEQENNQVKKITETEGDIVENVQQEEEEDQTGLFAISLREILENNEFFFHFTMFCLWFLITCINIPAALTCAHNFKYNPKLLADPSFIPGVTLCACALPLWQMELPKVSRKGYLELSYTIYFLAVLGQIYGVFSIYVLNYTLTAVMALVVLHQLIAPREFTGVYVEPDNELDPNFKDIKSKME